MTLDEVAKYLKIDDQTAYRLSQQGKLPAFKVGGQWRFKQEDINKWINEQYNQKKNKNNRLSKNNC